MKKGVSLFVIVILMFCLSFISALPVLFYQNPTPVTNANATSIGSFEINVSLEKVTNLSTLIFNFANTNYTLYNESLILMMNFENRSSLSENDTHVVDFSNYENNGTITDASFTTSGRHGGAYSFSGFNDSIEISDSSEFNLSEEFTLSLWVNLESKNFVQIAGGDDTFCGLLEDGNVTCWGKNDYGQLGNGSIGGSSKVPVYVEGGWNFNKLQSCIDGCFATLENGTLLAWGLNAQGQIGDGTTTYRAIPVVVEPTLNFSQVSAGSYNTCGVLINGTGLCWGQNSNGELGNGSTIQSKVPIPISGDYNWSYIDRGREHTCGLLTNGSILCWGKNNNGQVGDGTTTTPRTSPVFINTDETFVNVSCGNSHSCGLLSNGSVMCWGASSYTGNGSTTFFSISSPVFSSSDKTFVEISTGDYMTFAKLENGSVFGWGNSNFGQIGTVQDFWVISTPQQLVYEKPILSAEGGDYHSCILDNESKVLCFGDRDQGELGDGFSQVYTPNYMLTDYEFESLTLGYFHSCGNLSNGTILCWGGNKDGAMGNPDYDIIDYPTKIWDYSFIDLESTYEYSCGLLTNGSLYCWGKNDYGQLGIGSVTSEDVTSPTPIASDWNYSLVEIGYRSTCAILVNGSVVCWGDNTYSQLANGSSGEYTGTPQLINGGWNFSDIKGNGNHFCGLLVNGSAACWGINNLGHLGVGDASARTEVVLVDGNYNFSKLDVSNIHSCGILENGSVMCWGRGTTFGAVGDGTYTNRYSPVFIDGEYNASTISCSQTGTVMILTNGSVLAWGRNGGGSLGDGTATVRPSPVPVKNYSLTELYSGWIRVCGKTIENKFVCWGVNYFDSNLNYHYTDSPYYPREIISGTLLGKSPESFAISSLFSGNAKLTLFTYETEVDLDSGWNHLILNYDGTSVKTYLNGELYSSATPFLNPTNESSQIFIGDKVQGKIDEVRIWNRSLSASEISQVYKSNIEKVNATSWNFYSNQTALTPGDYYYYLFATDAHSSYKILTRLFRVIAAVTSSTDDTSSGGITISEERLEEGYTKIFVAGQSTSLSVGSKTYVTKVNLVSSESVSVSVGSKSVDVKVGTSEKVDLDSDGVYDLEIIVNSVDSSGNANLEFKAISEAVLSEVQEEVSEESKGEEEKPLADKTSNWYLYVLGAVALVIVLGIVLEKIVKCSNKKHKKKRK